MNLKTCISNNESIWDICGQWLPAGNYYFLIKDINCNIYGGDVVTGNIICRSFCAEYRFFSKQVLRLIAVSQSRMLRLADLPSDENMPNYPSPPSSPDSNYPSELEIKSTTHSTTYPTTHSTTNRILPSIQASYQPAPTRQEPPSCTICLMEITNNIKALPCAHVFHTHCIDRWLRLKNSCPLCRQVDGTQQTTNTYRVPNTQSSSSSHRRHNHLQSNRNRRATNTLLRGRSTPNLPPLSRNNGYSNTRSAIERTTSELNRIRERQSRRILEHSRRYYNY